MPCCVPISSKRGILPTWYVPMAVLAAGSKVRSIENGAFVPAGKFEPSLPKWMSPENWTQVLFVCAVFGQLVLLPNRFLNCPNNLTLSKPPLTKKESPRETTVIAAPDDFPAVMLVAVPAKLKPLEKSAPCGSAGVGVADGFAAFALEVFDGAGDFKPCGEATGDACGCVFAVFATTTFLSSIANQISNPMSATTAKTVNANPPPTNSKTGDEPCFGGG